MTETKLFRLTETPDGSTLDGVQFDPVPLGEDATRTVYIQNKIKHDLTVDTIETENVSESGSVEVIDAPTSVAPNDAAAVQLRADSIAAETLDGLSAEVRIEATAVIPP